MNIALFRSNGRCSRIQECDAVLNTITNLKGQQN